MSLRPRWKQALVDLSIGDRLLRDGRELVVVGFSSASVVPAVVLLEDPARPGALIAAAYSN